MSTTKETIERKIHDGLQATHLDVTNESHMHNVPDGSESHFRVIVVSDAFNDTALLGRHRKVNALLKEELAGKIHALALHTFTPDEWLSRGESAEASPQCLGGSKK